MPSLRHFWNVFEDRSAPCDFFIPTAPSQGIKNRSLSLVVLVKNKTLSECATIDVSLIPLTAFPTTCFWRCGSALQLGSEARKEGRGPDT